MSHSINRVTILGHLGKDPESRSTQDGRKIVNMTIATSESWKDKNTGERKSRSEWHRVVVYNEGLAEVAEKYLEKGSRVLVEGSLATRKWTDQAGQEKYSTEVVLQGYDSKLVLLDSPDKGERQAKAAPVSDSLLDTVKPADWDESIDIPF